jgi:hypothetical protein
MLLDHGVECNLTLKIHISLMKTDKFRKFSSIVTDCVCG